MPNDYELDIFYRKELRMDSKSYTKAYRAKKLPIFRKVIKSLNLPQGCSVLEVGPGPIGIASEVPKNCRYISLEPGSGNNSNLLKYAHKSNHNITCIESLCELSTIDIKFDLIFSNASFEHMISPREALAQLVNYAHKGAYIIIGVPSRQLEFPDEAMVRAGVFEKVDYCSTHLHAFSHKSMMTLFASFNIHIDSTLYTLTEGRMKGYELVRKSWHALASNRRNTISLRWSLLHLLSLVYHRIIGCKIIDPTLPGDDRGETLYIGQIISQ